MNKGYKGSPMSEGARAYIVSMPGESCHAHVSEVMHNLQHPVVIPQEAGIVAGLWVEGKVAKNHHPLLLFPRRLALLNKPFQLCVTQAASKFDEPPFCLGDTSRTCGIVLVLRP